MAIGILAFYGENISLRLLTCLLSRFLDASLSRIYDMFDVTLSGIIVHHKIQKIQIHTPLTMHIVMRRGPPACKIVTMPFHMVGSHLLCTHSVVAWHKKMTSFDWHPYHHPDDIWTIHECHEWMSLSLFCRNIFNDGFRKIFFSILTFQSLAFRAGQI